MLKVIKIRKEKREVLDLADFYVDDVDLIERCKNRKAEGIHGTNFSKSLMVCWSFQNFSLGCAVILTNVVKVKNLPTKVTKLELDTVEIIEKLPKNLKRLAIRSRIPNFDGKLPKTLKSVTFSGMKYQELEKPLAKKGILDIISPRYEKDFPKFQNIRKLVFHLIRFPSSINLILPMNLVSFVAVNSTFDFSPAMEKLPDSLESIKLENCEIITSFPPFGNNITNVDFSECNLNGVPSFEGTSLTYLRIDAIFLDKTEKLSDTIAILILTDCSLKKIKNLPKSLTNLNVSYNLLKRIPKLPKSLVDLDVSHNESLRVPKLPSGLKYLNCSNVSLGEKTLQLPEFLREFRADRCDMKGLPILPRTLEFLSVSFNPLNEIRNLPVGLEKLDVSGTSDQCFVEPVKWSVIGGMPSASFNFLSYYVFTHSLRFDAFIADEHSNFPEYAYKKWRRSYWKVRGIFAVKRFISAFQRSQKRRKDIHARTMQLIRLVPGGIDARPSEASQGQWLDL